ncbi:MAG: nucleotide sugar dehydrogenase [archaeon]
MRICIIGAGYVGIPLAVEFSRHYDTVVFDIDKDKIKKLKEGLDPTMHFTPDELKKSNIFFTHNESDIKSCNIIFIAVPTPLTKSKKPDLYPLENASEICGRNLSKGSIVVYESTVYPGVTEEVCIPILESNSGLKCGGDFKVGYSPERISPGDKIRTVSNLVKVVSGIDDETAEELCRIYSKIIKVGVFKAKNIKVAEAAKVIENTQRDINIALINEFALIFNRMGIRTKDVLEAASTKWNFHKYTPGLVGGHCISVDPYYLLYKSEEVGYHPKVILAGRDVNDFMPKHVAELVIKGLNEAGKVLKDSKVLILGFTFKENINDTRNTRVLEVFNSLEEFGIKVYVHDPWLSNEEIKRFGIESVQIESLVGIDCVVLAVAHDCFKVLTLDKLLKIMGKNPVLVDIKYLFDESEAFKNGFIYKSL